MNISISEILLVLLVALLVVKPEQLPGVAKSMANMIKSIRHVIGKIKTEMNDIIDAPDSSKK